MIETQPNIIWLSMIHLLFFFVRIKESECHTLTNYVTEQFTDCKLHVENILHQKAFKSLSMHDLAFAW